jgi:hypothetical protein
MARVEFPVVELEAAKLRWAVEAVLGEVRTLDAGLRRRGLI